MPKPPRILLVALLALGTPARPPGAQEPAVPRPDTLGADFDDRAPGTGSPGDFDFLVGQWTYRYQPRNPATGAWGPVQEGAWSAARRPDAPFVQDEFTGQAGAILTFRSFNPERRVWEIQGVRLKRGVWQPGVSWSDRENRYLVQDDPERKIRVRIRYYAITRDRFLWRADGTNDGGKTWMRDIMLIEARRR
jgi:hypothetical protein